MRPAIEKVDPQMHGYAHYVPKPPITQKPYMGPPSLQPRGQTLGAANESGNDLCNVRFGSLADMAIALRDVR